MSLTQLIKELFIAILFKVVPKKYITNEVGGLKIDNKRLIGDNQRLEKEVSKLSANNQRLMTEVSNLYSRDFVEDSYAEIARVEQKYSELSSLYNKVLLDNELLKRDENP